VTDLLGMAVIGVGYWGPNLVRNVSANPRMQLRWVCDLDLGRARAAVGHSSTALLTRDISEVLDDPQVDAVAIATPAANHLDVGMAAINARKNVLVEKPLATTAADARRLAMLAAEAGLVLMCDHTYCYTPAVAKIRELVASGVLGEVQYVDSVRIGLGLVQPDVDVLWDLAPHDLSVLDFVLPDHMNPLAVAAHAADPIGTGRNCVAYLTLTLPRRAIAHAHVNWLSPTKIRTMIIGGSQRMLVWDDLNPAQRVSIFDRGVDLVDSALATEERREALVSYRTGDMTAPALPEREALANVLDEFLDAIVTRRAPATDGWAGLRVLTTLEAAARSIEQDGALVPLSADAQ
jgi:predicted dehydrogenase